MRHWLALFLLLIPYSAVAQTADTGVDLLHSGLEAMGGEPKIRAITSIRIQATEQRQMLEESERPEGPYIVEDVQLEEWRDLTHHDWKSVRKSHVAVMPDFSATAVVSGNAATVSYGGPATADSGGQLQQAEEALALSPERAMITALAAPDLHRQPDLMLQGVPHHSVEFTWQRSPVRLYLNADTHLPTAIEWESAYPFDMFWSIWGDVTTRIYYSFWWLQNGIRYPLQADVVRNGLPDHTVTINKLEFNTTIAADEFSISEANRTAFAAKPDKAVDDRSPDSQTTELAPGIVFIPGAWNTTLVHQDDGIVVLEAPISSGYSAKVIEIAKAKFPGVPIKAVITTSDAWPHIGGVREYVAQGVPVYVLDRTVPLIERFLRAPRTRYPDSLARSLRAADLHSVSAKTVIGSGANRMELYPIHGETSERQMMVYFPEHKLLYGSDAFQQLEEGKFFYPQTVSEVAAAVTREHLQVDRFFMMHIGPNPWSMAQQAVAEANH